MCTEDGLSTGDSAVSKGKAEQIPISSNFNDPQLNFDEQTRLESPYIEGMPYYVETADGLAFSGRVGPDKLLPRINTLFADQYAVFWGDEALSRIARNI